MLVYVQHIWTNQPITPEFLPLWTTADRQAAGRHTWPPLFSNWSTLGKSADLRSPPPPPMLNGRFRWRWRLPLLGWRPLQRNCGAKHFNGKLLRSCHMTLRVLRWSIGFLGIIVEYKKCNHIPDSSEIDLWQLRNLEITNNFSSENRCFQVIHWVRSLEPSAVPSRLIAL